MLALIVCHQDCARRTAAYSTASFESCPKSPQVEVDCNEQRNPSLLEGRGFGCIEAASLDAGSDSIRRDKAVIASKQDSESSTKVLGAVGANKENEIGLEL